MVSSSSMCSYCIIAKSIYSSISIVSLPNQSNHLSVKFWISGKIIYIPNIILYNSHNQAKECFSLFYQIIKMILQNGKQSGCCLSPWQYYCIIYIAYNTKAYNGSWLSDIIDILSISNFIIWYTECIIWYSGYNISFYLKFLVYLSFFCYTIYYTINRYIKKIFII